MHTGFGRRGLLGGLGGIAAAATLPWDLALAQSAGTLRVGMTAAAVPLTNGVPDQGAEGHRFMGITLYDQLVEWDLSKADAAAVLRPGLASEWKVDPANPKRWVFTLRDGVKFHDGKLLTAQDVAFSFDRVLKSDAPHFDQRAAAFGRVRIPTVARWEALDERTFALETSTVDSTVPYGVSWIGIVHQGAWEAAGKNWDAYNTKAVGTGPWKLESWSIRERAVLLRNPDYWDAPRVPKCERLVLLPLAEPNTRVAALRSNQVDWIEAPPPDAVPSLKQAGFTIVTNQYPHNWTWQLAVAEGSPWRDARVRRGANLAIDRAAMKEMLGGLMDEGAGLLPKGHPWNEAKTFKWAYDPAAAKKQLAEAGITPKTPLKTKIGISTSGSGQMQPMAMNEALQQMLKEVGIEIEFEVFEWNTLLSIWRDGWKAPSNRGITGINISFTAIDPFTAMIRFLRSDLTPPAGNNWGGFGSPDYDALIGKILSEFDPAAQDRLCAELHGKIVDDALFLFVAHDLNPRAMNKKVQGFVQARSWFQDLTPVRVTG
ncbi:ABC transporter substrate-binding protein [Roseicella sp. DB1501]|uniref:ABC transporter substrate-binding protein n=1 Tax=Roseicella sp. DB1501 TaxID=2730925 RepID=UPI001C2C1AD1|nr:ABC transporter substrate-binding protein [Roseicella sp. DB1501]